MSERTGVAFALALGLGAVACKDTPAAPDAAPASASASASALASAPATARDAMPPPMPTVVELDGGANRPHGCTAIGVKGSVTHADAGAVSDAMHVEGETLTLTAGAKVTVKGVASGREIAFLGPGSALPCRGGDEDEQWLYAGSVDATMTAGPGAETWLVVPAYAVIRFSGAALHAELGPAANPSLAVSIQNGAAWVLPIAGLPADAGVAADPSGFVRLDAGKALTLPKSGAPAKAAVDRCVSAANDARLLAAALVAPDASVGDLAGKHIEARKRARALCTAALASAGLDPKEKARAEAADASWRVVLTP